MPFLPIANKGKIDKVTDSPKFGTVVDNNDPLKLGRVKVEITGIFEGSLQSLPWVRRKMDSVFCGADCEMTYLKLALSLKLDGIMTIILQCIQAHRIIKDIKRVHLQEIIHTKQVSSSVIV